MPNIISYYGNANQNHNEISPRISENGYYKKEIISVSKDMGREPLGTAGGNVNGGSYGKQYAAAAKSLQSCLTLCDPVDGSPPGSPVPGILQARTHGKQYGGSSKKKNLKIVLPYYQAVLLLCIY